MTQFSQDMTIGSLDDVGVEIPIYCFFYTFFTPGGGKKSASCSCVASSLDLAIFLFLGFIYFILMYDSRTRLEVEPMNHPQIS
tara:strand:+ start:95 stop:343 length:249 start_codon:yes stop_codon:yes gene_type:complete